MYVTASQCSLHAVLFLSKHVDVGIQGNPPYLNVCYLFILFDWLYSISSFFKTKKNLLLWRCEIADLSRHDLFNPVKTDSSFWTLDTHPFFLLLVLVLLFMIMGFKYLEGWMLK